MNDDAVTENLDGLIAKIRDDGVEDGRRRAAELLRQAEDEAAAIRTAADQEASRILQDARNRIEQENEVARKALQRAARDVTAGLRVSLRRILEGLLRERCDAAFEGEGMRALIGELAGAWIRYGGARAIDLHVGEADASRLADGLVAELRERLKSGVELKIRNDLRHGFSISEADGCMQVEFTSDAAAEALLAALNPRFAKLFEGWRDGEASADA